MEEFQAPAMVGTSELDNYAQLALRAAGSFQQLSGASMAFINLTQVIDNSINVFDNSINSFESSISSFSNTEISVSQTTQQLGSSVEEAGEQAEKAAGPFQKLLDGFKSLKNIDLSFAKEVFDLSNQQRRAENQLKIILAKAGATKDVFADLKNKASEISSKTIYDEKTLMAGAGSLATQVKDPEAIGMMMGTMSNYAAGMSGGGALDGSEMSEYSNALGSAFGGDFTALEENGLYLSEIQKEIIANGTDMEKAVVLDDVISQSWGNLAEKMAGLPENKLIGIENSITGLKAAFGDMLTPAAMTLFGIFETHFPAVQGIMLEIGSVLGVVATIFSFLAEGAANIAGVILDNWSLISPIVYGIAAALLFYYGVMMITKAGQAIMTAVSAGYGIVTGFLSMWYGILSGSTAAASAAQMVYNGTLLACPITWIILAVIALVAVFFLAVAAVNKFSGSSFSALGLVGSFIGGFAANVINSFIFIYNIIADVVNFFANVWNDPISAVKILFLNMAISVLGYLSEMAKSVETIINRIPGVKVNISAGLDVFKSNLEAAVAEAKDASEWKDVVEKMEFKDAAEWTNKGNEIGEGIGNWIGETFDGLLDTSGFDLALDPSTYIPENPVNNLPEQLDTGGMEAYGGVGNPATVKGTGNGGAVKVENEEDLDWMRQLAERDYIARIAQNTLAPNIRVEFSGPITKEADTDKIFSHLNEGLQEMLATAPEGVYV